MQYKVMRAVSGIKRKSPRIGMRTIKTVVAVFICFVIGYLRGNIPFYSTITAVLCMSQDTDNSIQVAVTRILGTVIGALAGAAAMWYLPQWGLAFPSIGYYAVTAVMLIPLIYLPIRLGWPTAVALTCVIFLSVAINATDAPFGSTLERILDTMIGILVALPINILLPNHKKRRKTRYVVERPVTAEQVQEMVPPEAGSNSDFSMETHTEDSADTSRDVTGKRVAESAPVRDAEEETAEDLTINIKIHDSNCNDEESIGNNLADSMRKRKD